jgi:uncharacterized damage-inducible protein DinB
MSAKKGLGEAVRYARTALELNAQVLSSLSDQQYQTKLEYFGSSVGEHMRHILDHYSKLLESSGGAPVRYDERRRGTDVEVSRAAAIKVNEDVLQVLESQVVEKRDGSELLTVSFMTDPITSSEDSSSSSLHRELLFCAHHATHHQFVIKLMMRELGQKADDSLGLAVSTKSFHRENK